MVPPIPFNFALLLQACGLIISTANNPYHLQGEGPLARPVSMMANPSYSIGLVTSNHRPTWAEVDLNALAANFHIVKDRVGPDVNVMSVVKANAYGHGAVACARRLGAEGSDWFGVALPEEGVALRNAGITKPILCLAGFWGGQANACIDRNLVPVVYRLDMIEVFDRAARERGIVADDAALA